MRRRGLRLHPESDKQDCVLIDMTHNRHIEGLASLEDVHLSEELQYFYPPASGKASEDPGDAPFKGLADATGALPCKLMLLLYIHQRFLPRPAANLSLPITPFTCVPRSQPRR